jgi:pteridine reductase
MHHFEGIFYPGNRMSETRSHSLAGKTALITGAARRIGAAIATRLHAAGARVAIHHRDSAREAAELAVTLNGLRADSARIFQADLLSLAAPDALVTSLIEWAGQLDILINNASTFYPTPVGSVTDEQWNDLLGINLKVPFFLAQSARPHLQKTCGAIVNIVDIHAQRPLRHHSVYGAAKAGLAMLTRALAKELAPEIRVNGISPGAILWPETGVAEEMKQEILRQIPLGRPGTPEDIADGVLYLARDALYVTGQIIAFDGGRSVGW